MSKEPKPDRHARPWVTAAVLAPGLKPGSYIVGWHDDHGWVFPGGRVGAFEPLRDAAVREFKEETGYKVVIERQLRCFEILYHKADHHSIMVLYQGNVVGGGPGANDDLRQLAQMSFAELQKDDGTADVTLRVIAWCIVNGIH